MIMRRNVITVVDDNEEEKEYDHAHNNQQLETVEEPTDQSKVETSDVFCGMLDKDVATAPSYVFEDPKDGKEIEWETVPEASVEWLEDIDLPSDSKELSELFFSHFLPSIKGHAAIIDKYCSDRRSTYYSTVRDDKIRFHDDEADDPDWKVKNCYLLLIAAATEVETGVENLWLRGKSNGRRNYPNFGQYVPKNVFKVFQHVAPYCFCHEKYWYLEDRNKPWDIFLPCLKSFNDRRRKLIKLRLLMLDESMSGWRPKTSKLGGLPNYTFEARKPVPLGTMFRNGVECVSGCLVFQDVVQLPEIQSQKKYFGEQSSLPRHDEIRATTAEVLRQVEGSGIEKGGWVGGDAWFGSIMSSVEVFKRFGVHSTFVVKNNTAYYPMRVLHRILIARYNNRPAGHWVVMHTKISDVPIMVVAYAWSNRGVTYLVSTCGSTKILPEKYQSSYEDDYGNIRVKEINRPWVAHFLYKYLPLIDEHNKQRQSLLNLERCWLTKSCWFRLLTTIVGMSVVDMHRWYRNARGMRREVDNEIQIRKFSDLLCISLDDYRRKQYAPRRHLAAIEDDVQIDGRPSLVRIRGKDGSSTRHSTEIQRGRGRSMVGSAVVMNCYMCRKYLGRNDNVVYRQTSFCCSLCLMPLCRESRVDTEAQRYHKCFDEHMCTDDCTVACNGEYHVGKKFPADKQVPHPLRKKRKVLSRGGGSSKR